MFAPSCVSWMTMQFSMVSDRHQNPPGPCVTSLASSLNSPCLRRSSRERSCCTSAERRSGVGLTARLVRRTLHVADGGGGSVITMRPELPPSVCVLLPGQHCRLQLQDGSCCQATAGVHKVLLVA
jgi:hypothetical protein